MRTAASNGARIQKKQRENCKSAGETGSLIKRLKKIGNVIMIDFWDREMGACGSSLT